jgi:hypothetical protein
VSAAVINRVGRSTRPGLLRVVLRLETNETHDPTASPLHAFP